jgi:signal transduction histidine kinase
MVDSHDSLVFLAFLAAMLAAALALYAWYRRRAGLRPVARKLLPELMSEGMLVLDARDRVVDLNQAAAAILGVPLKGAIGRDVASILRAMPRLLELVRASTPQAEIVLGTGATAAYYDVSISSLTHRQNWRMGKLVVLYDVTEQRRYQEHLAEQQRDLAILAERERLSRELQDSLDAALGSVIDLSRQARSLLPDDRPAADAALGRLTAIARDANVDVREYLLGVRSATASAEGLLSTLRQYATSYGEMSGMRVEWVAPEQESDPVLDLWVQVQLVRIAQEALTNARHRRATRARVSYREQDGHVQIVIQDDGAAPAPSQMAVPHSPSRPHTMRERAEEVGGSLEIRPAPGGGTLVIVQVPLRPPPADRFPKELA